uniref:Uncharacterized protein n=1 Tax=Oryza barthii TaxID=65489 RepID=A0A0D3FYX6_9ORYZ
MAGCQSTVSSTEDVLVRPKRFPRLNKVNRPKQQCRFVNCKWRISYLQLGVGSIINLEKYDDAYGKFKIDTRCRQSHTMF